MKGRFIGAGIALASGIEVFSQALPDLSIGNLLNASATAVLGALCWIQATRTIPGIVKANAEAMEKVTEDHKMATSVISEEHSRVVRDLLSEAAKDRALMHEDNTSIMRTVMELCKNCASHTELLRQQFGLSQLDKGRP